MAWPPRGFAAVACRTYRSRLQRSPTERVKLQLVFPHLHNVVGQLPGLLGDGDLASPGGSHLSCLLCLVFFSEKKVQIQYKYSE